MSTKCSCGGTFEHREGLDGLFCDRCDQWMPDDTINTEGTYSEDSLKSLRGVPHNTFTIGTESKGRVCVQVPANATKQARERIIKENLESLKFMIESAKEMGLNIFSGR